MPDSIYNRESLKNLLIEKEGRRSQKYKDKGGYSIGIGHYITPEENKSGRIYGVNFRDGLSTREMDYIFKKDLKSKIDVVRETLPDFDSYSDDIQNQFVGANFRGSFLQSPKTISLIKQKRYKDASNEFLNNKEYRTTKTPAIRKRMEEVSGAIRSLEQSNVDDEWEIIQEPTQSELTPEEQKELEELENLAKDGII